MSRLQDIIDLFSEADYQATLAMLLDYSENLPPLPEEFQEARDAGFNRVAECETPVFVFVDVKAGNVEIDAPESLIHLLKLDSKLGTRRMYGLSAVYSRIKSEVRKANGEAQLTT